ncbi:MAG: hypothetical protein HRT72_03250 [Flavobacteriales bacterium]|nr:hypothetical protein [Flavobacteriales bacterium]
MYKYLVLAFCISILFGCESDPIVRPFNGILIDNLEKLENANQYLKPYIDIFDNECLPFEDCDYCIDQLIDAANGPYQKSIVGGLIFHKDPAKSFLLVEDALRQVPEELRFNIAYAMALHRNGYYDVAIPFYLEYQKYHHEDFRVNYGLAECYLNVNDYRAAYYYWTKHDPDKNANNIHLAMHNIRAKSDQHKYRSELIEKVKNEDVKSAYDLLYLDLNWEYSIWNTGIQEAFIRPDLDLVKKTFGEFSYPYSELGTYNYIKHLIPLNPSADSIQSMLYRAEILINGFRFPNHGNVTADLLNMAFFTRAINARDFYISRGNEMVELAFSFKSIELFKIYADLKGYTKGVSVMANMWKTGWIEFKDEGYAIKYLGSFRDQLTYENAELSAAISNFPNSAKLQSMRMNIGSTKHIDIIPDVVSTLKKEFKTFDSDKERTYTFLNRYFSILNKILTEKESKLKREQESMANPEEQIIE